MQSLGSYFKNEKGFQIKNSVVPPVTFSSGIISGNLSNQARLEKYTGTGCELENDRGYMVQVVIFRQCAFQSNEAVKKHRFKN